MKEQGQMLYAENAEKLNQEIRRIFREEESSLDETTSVQIYYNHNAGAPHFRFYIKGSFVDTGTSYYPANFTRGGEIFDELEGGEKDVCIYDWLGSEIPKAKR